MARARQTKKNSKKIQKALKTQFTEALDAYMEKTFETPDGAAVLIQ